MSISNEDALRQTYDSLLPGNPYSDENEVDYDYYDPALEELWHEENDNSH